MSINLKYPLRRSPKGAFATNDVTIDAVKDDLRLLILTNHGERVIHGDFGANLRKLVFEFEGADLRQAIVDSIISAAEKWMPYVTIVDVQVFDSTTTPTLRQHDVHIEIEFLIGSEITGTLTEVVSLS